MADSNPTLFDWAEQHNRRTNAGWKKPKRCKGNSALRRINEGSRIPLEGTEVGWWTVLECVGREEKWKSYVYRCRCRCGTERLVCSRNLLPKKSKGGLPASRSCGCLVRYHHRQKAKHGGTIGYRMSQAYRSWLSMRRRCKEQTTYINNGITVCERWARSFQDFLSDVGDAPAPGYTLDRIDCAKGYEPGNVRWATATEQARNTKSTRFLTYNGETRCVAEWAEILGIHPNTIRSRLRKGLPLDQVFLARTLQGYGKEAEPLVITPILPPPA